MATVVSNEFTSYDFTPEEMTSAMILNDLQRQYFQTLYSQYATERLAIHFDATDPVRFAQQEAELAGKMGVLRQLLDDSYEAAESLIQTAASN